MRASPQKCPSAHAVPFPPSDTVKRRSLLQLSEFSPSEHNGSTPPDGVIGRLLRSLLWRQVEMATCGRVSEEC